MRTIKKLLNIVLQVVLNSRADNTDTKAESRADKLKSGWVFFFKLFNSRAYNTDTKAESRADKSKSGRVFFFKLCSIHVRPTRIPRQNHVRTNPKVAEYFSSSWENTRQRFGPHVILPWYPCCPHVNRAQLEENIQQLFDLSARDSAFGIRVVRT